MFKHKNINKETIEILLKENKKLKRENYRLQESLDELARYKEEYENLIKTLHSVKKEYIQKVKDFNEIEKEYKKELDKIITKTK